MVKAKIVATLGPASNSEKVLRKMFTSGLDVVRLNFSHGSRDEHLKRINLVRTLNGKMRRAIKIMQDLEGYRLRIGSIERSVELKKGARLYLTQDEVAGTVKEVHFDYKGSLDRIKRGSSIYIDDGRIKLVVEEVGRKRLKAKVATPGVLTAHKGINIPAADLEFDPMTEKDREDIKVAVSEGLDYVAQSFVRDARDIKSLKSLLKPSLPKCGIFAKIESAQAIMNIESIIAEADGIMVARGDMGICVPIYKVPFIQKDIIRRCIVKRKPVIVATQMLESMTRERIPTRAEVSDVANAILDGATHLMLSGETAVGGYPSHAVRMMNEIIKYTEQYRRRL